MHTWPRSDVLNSVPAQRGRQLGHGLFNEHFFYNTLKAHLKLIMRKQPSTTLT